MTKKPGRTKTFLENLMDGLLGPSDQSLAESSKIPNHAVDTVDNEIPSAFLKAPYVGRCTICKTRDLPSPEQDALCEYWACEGHCEEYHQGMDYHRMWDGRRTAKKSSTIAHSSICVCLVCRAKGPQHAKELPIVTYKAPSVPEFGAVEEIDLAFPVDEDWRVGQRTGSGRISLPKELGGLDT